MGVTYDPTDRGGLTLVREAVGDTDTNARICLDDSVIEAYLETEGSVEAASMKCLDLLLARFAREADTGLKAAGLVAQMRFERLKDLRRLMQEQIARSGGPSAPGLSVPFREAQHSDSSMIQQPFHALMNDLED